MAKKVLKRAAKAISKKVAAKPAVKPTKGPRKKATKQPTKRPTKKTGKQAGQGAVAVEATWIVWQNTDGIWVGTKSDFARFKRRDTIVCDVFNNGKRREFKALRRAVQVGRVLRQTYANFVRQYGQEKVSGQWLGYDDAAQEGRIQEWERWLNR